MIVSYIDRWKGKEKPSNSHLNKEVEETIKVNMYCGFKEGMNIDITHKQLDEYSLRTRNQRIYLTQLEFEKIIEDYKKIKEKVVNKEIVPCERCKYNYHSPENDYCSLCEKERFELWETHGNEMVKAWGYKPFPEMPL